MWRLQWGYCRFEKRKCRITSDQSPLTSILQRTQFALRSRTEHGMKCIYALHIRTLSTVQLNALQRGPNERNGDSVSDILVHLIYIRSALATTVQLCICYKTKAPFMGCSFAHPFCGPRESFCPCSLSGPFCWHDVLMWFSWCDMWWSYIHCSIVLVTLLCTVNALWWS